MATPVRQRKQNAKSLVGTSGLNKESGITYKQGYQSLAYPLLPSKSPTDTLPENEKSASSATKIIGRVTKDRKPSPISNIVCLGISEKSHLTQFVTVLQIVAQLSLTKKEILDNLFIQDPNIEPEIHDPFENHGFKVVQFPEVLDYMSANTLIFDFYACAVGEVPDVLEAYTQDRHMSEVEMICPVVCPTTETGLAIPQAPMTSQELKFGGEPMRNDKDKIDILYHAATQLGFRDSIADFSQAYQAGLRNEYGHGRDILIGTYVAARHAELLTARLLKSITINI
ncbi:hypothetical protein DL98DRAFT_595085 [Cadophora sp. DSE1049]|nr:hypothetical protein DL98DRAFT_595085 [Cadophora sp. DSE1049]